MFEVLGSWLDWKKSEVQAAVSNAAFNHHCNKIEKDYAKNPSTYISKPQETKKPEIKETAANNTENKTAEVKPETSTKSQDTENEDVAETAKMFAESFDKILNDSKNLDDIMDDGLKDIVESIKKYQQKKQELAKVNDLDPAEQEHPEDDTPEETEVDATKPAKKIIDLKLQDSKRLLDVIYQVTLENAETILKYTVADDENISDEEKEKRNKMYDETLLTLLAKALTGLEDVSDVDLKALEKDLQDKLTEGAIIGATQSALTVFVNSNIPDGKPLDLTKNKPMEIVGDPGEESPTQAQEPNTDPTEPAPNPEPTPSASNNSTRKNSRRKK